MLFEFTIQQETRKSICHETFTIPYCRLLSLVVIGCNREPFANATVDLNPAYVGETSLYQLIQPIRSSVEWDMDDGIIYLILSWIITSWIRAFTMSNSGPSEPKETLAQPLIPMEVIGSEITIIVKEYWSRICDYGLVRVLSCIPL